VGNKLRWNHTKTRDKVACKDHVGIVPSHRFTLIFLPNLVEFLPKASLGCSVEKWVLRWKGFLEMARVVNGKQREKGEMKQTQM